MSAHRRLEGRPLDHPAAGIVPGPRAYRLLIRSGGLCEYGIHIGSELTVDPDVEPWPGAITVPGWPGVVLLVKWSFPPAQARHRRRKRCCGILWPPLRDGPDWRR